MIARQPYDALPFVRWLRNRFGYPFVWQCFQHVDAMLKVCLTLMNVYIEHFRE